MKKTQSALSVLFVLIVMLSSFTLNAYAQNTSYNGDISLRNSTILNKASSIKISSIEASCSATLKSQYKTSLKITIELQKKKSTGYETVQTWTTSGTGTSLSISKSRTINALSSYRLMTSFTAGNEKQITYSYPA